jgi:hypothetical protein
MAAGDCVRSNELSASSKPAAGLVGSAGAGAGGREGLQFGRFAGDDAAAVLAGGDAARGTDVVQLRFAQIRGFAHWFLLKRYCDVNGLLTRHILHQSP